MDENEKNEFLSFFGEKAQFLYHGVKKIFHIFQHPQTKNFDTKEVGSLYFTNFRIFFKSNKKQIKLMETLIKVKKISFYSIKINSRMIIQFQIHKF